MKNTFFFFTISLFVLALSCKKSDNPNPINNPPQITSEYWVQAEFDGVSKNIELGKNQFGLSSGNSGDIELPICKYDYQSCLQQTELVGTEFEYKEAICIEFIKLYNDTCDQEWENFADLFVPQTFTYSPNYDTPGIYILYNDENKKLFSTRLGAQSSSSFSITASSSLDPDIFGKYSQKVEGEFSCTLYDDQGGKIEITNGKFSLLYTPS
ncbi:MAG: hypothetical protein R3B93_19065 [Bacteroidia bacterium]